MQMQIMTFNIRGSFHEDGANDWDQRRDLNIATILKYAPDIIGFQEAQSGNLDDYALTLTGYDVELGALSIRQTENYHRVPIFWKSNLFEKVDQGHFYLSETPDTWSVGWDAMFPRVVTWVRLRVLGVDTELVVVNTHFPHRQENHTARTESAKLIVDRVRAFVPEGCPVVIMADFNALPSSEAYQVFAQHGFQDTYTANGSRADVSTFHGFQGEAFEYAGARIDWILTKNGTRAFSVQECTVITDAQPPIYPSDHYPVLAKLDLT